MNTRYADPEQFDRWMTGIIGGMEGAVAEPAVHRPCEDAPASFVRIVKFANGRLVFFDPPHLQPDGLNAAYHLVNDHTFVVDDTQDNVRPSPLTVSFVVVGNRMTLRPQTDDPWTLSGFRAGPFVRID
jgi:hypothetical protein